MWNMAIGTSYQPKTSLYNTTSPYARNLNDFATPDSSFENAGQVNNQDGKLSELVAKEECQTCKNRKYQDQSDDSWVSFQTPTHISPSSAPQAVASHELEHVYREKARAEGEQGRVVSQRVMIHTAVCPECHRTYVSGGTTTTTVSKRVASAYNVGNKEQKPQFEFAI